MHTTHMDQVFLLLKSWRWRFFFPIAFLSLFLFPKSQGLWFVMFVPMCVDQE